MDSPSNDRKAVAPTNDNQMGERNLRILMIAPTPFFADRGCHVRIYEEIRELNERGHEVVLCTYHHGRDLPEVETVRIPNVPWYQKLDAGPSWQKLYLDGFLFARAARVAREMDPDVIYSHLHEGAFLGIFLGRRLKRPVVFDYQGSLAGEIADHGFAPRGSLRYRFFRRVESWVEKRVDLVLTSAGSAADRLRRKGTVHAPIIPVPDAVDPRTFHPVPREDDLRQKLNVPSDRKVVVFLGLLKYYQGVDVLLEAATSVIDRAPDTHFLILGYPNVTRYRRKAASMGLDDYVTFGGRVPYFEASQHLVFGDIAVAPKLSRSEANGKILNYMACGLPTIAFDRPIDREILGDAGVYVPYGNVDDLSTAIVDLLNDEERRQQLGERARQRVLEHFSWAKMGDELERSLLELCNAPPRFSPSRAQRRLASREYSVVGATDGPVSGNDGAGTER